jgi:hypothetical protein
MRRFAFMVVAVMALSFALVPFNTVHAHIANDHEHAVMHGGHVHDLQHEQAVPGESALDHIIAVQMVAADHGTVSLTVPWMPVLWLVMAMMFGIAAIREVFRPPGRDPRPLNRRSWHLPPLRGPPLLSI